MNSETPNHQNAVARGEPFSDRPLGMLLREAREAQKLSVADIGARLRLTSNVVEAIEREDFDRLGASVYLRGYLTSYARCVGVDTARVDQALSSVPQPELPLKSASHTPHWQHLYERYAKRAIYIALTGVIVFPIVFLSLRDRLPIDPPRLVSLDGVNDNDNAATTDPTVDGKTPVTASLAAFYRESEQTSVPLATPDASMASSLAPASADATSVGVDVSSTSPDAATSSSQLRLVFNGSSWVEVLGKDGSRLAYGLIAAGEVRHFDAGQVARVSIGDSDAVNVSMDGRLLNLDAFRHAKVARFALSSAGEPVAPGG